MGTAAVLAAAGGGVAAGALVSGHDEADSATVPPAALTSAAETERALLAGVEQALSAQTASAAILARIRVDHSAHLSALEGAIALIAGPPTPPKASPTPTSAVPGRPPGLAALHAAELSASAAAAAGALELSGAEAALLASIAACEACHAELLT